MTLNILPEEQDIDVEGDDGGDYGRALAAHDLRDWERSRPPKRAKQPKKGSGRGDVGMELLAWTLVGVPGLLALALVIYIAVGHAAK